MNTDGRKMNQEYYISLIIQQLSGTLSEVEASDLDIWLSHSESNKSVQKKLIDSWNKADSYKDDTDVDEIAAWKIVTSRIADKSKVIDLKPKNNALALWKKSLIIAASIAVLLTCSWLFLSRESNQAVIYATNAHETLEVILPDGSLVNLNSNSELTYLETNDTRIARLDGEALFEISHDNSHPFTVNSHRTSTTVLGTKFNVRGREKETIVVSLFEGKVSFEAANQSAVILAPGEMVSYNSTGNKVEKNILQNENTMAWKTKELKFKNDNLEEVINTLEKYFYKKIELVTNDNSCRFTGAFEDPEYQDVIEVLEYTYDMNFESSINSDKISIINCK